MSRFGYRKRVFLASISTGHTSYILTEVESSRGGEYKWGHCMLTMADCRRRIQLEFFLGTLRARRESLRKIDLLMNQLVQFRTVANGGRSDRTVRTKAKGQASKVKESLKEKSSSKWTNKQEKPCGIML